MYVPGLLSTIVSCSPARRIPVSNALFVAVAVWGTLSSFVNLTAVPALTSITGSSYEKSLILTSTTTALFEGVDLSLPLPLTTI